MISFLIALFVGTTIGWFLQKITIRRMLDKQISKMEDEDFPEDGVES